MTFSFDAMVRAHDHMVEARLAAGWDFEPEYGWAAPCGTPESDWLDAGLPLPEDPDFATSTCPKQVDPSPVLS